MELTIKQVAEAFSRHDFQKAYPYIADDVRWNLVGSQPFSGKDAVVKACNESAAYLVTTTTTFSKFKLVADGDTVVIDTLAEYVDEKQESSLIASCDIYDFADGKLAEITSYTFELKA